MTSTDVLADRARAYLEALNAADPDRIASFVTDDFHNDHSSALGTSLRGRDAYRQRLPVFLARFPGLRYEVEDLVAQGDRVVVAYVMRFRHHPEGGGERPVTIRGVFRLRFEGEHIAHRVDYWDGVSYQRQIEAEVEPGSAEVGA